VTSRGHHKLIDSMLLRLEISRDLEPIASRIDNGDHCERSLTDRSVRATSAAIKSGPYTKVVVVTNHLGVTDGLHLAHHELVFWRDRFHHTLLLLFCESVVLDLLQVHIQLLAALLSSAHTLFIIIGEVDSFSESVDASSEFNLLLYSQSHIGQSNLTVFVIQIDFSLADFIGFKGVLVKLSLDLGRALREATPS